jgi:prephenate dehydrogenase
MGIISGLKPSPAYPLNRVGVIGCGLMGGSIALASGRAGVDVVVFDVDEGVLAEARAAGLRSVDSPGAACADRDLVLLCTPVDQLLGLIPQIRPYLEDDTIVSDIGSVKTPARVLISSLSRERVAVIPSHPMAGSERSGFEAADSTLLEGCTWLVCGDVGNGDAQRLAAFVVRLGTERVLSCSVEGVSL